MCWHDLEYLLFDCDTGETWGPFSTISEARSKVERLDVSKWEILAVDGDGLVNVVV